MAEQKAAAEDWLPPGWTVETRVRKNGKKDRCYTDPSKGHKFFSKPEVLRYLNSIESNHPESEGRRRSSRNRSAIDSPAVAEQVNLAENGINGQKNNNQSSVPGEVSKDKEIRESCAGDSAVAERVNLAENGIKGQKNNNQSSTLGRVLKDKESLESCAGGEETFSVLGGTDIAKNTVPDGKDTCSVPDIAKSIARGGEETFASCSKLPETMDVDQNEKNDLNSRGYDSTPVPGVPPKKLSESGVDNNGNKISPNGPNKSNNNKKLDLPRRASKRLAGIEIGPTPELKTNNRSRRVSARCVDETGTSTARKSLDKRDANTSKDIKETTDQKKECPIDLPSQISSIPEAHDLQVETTNNKADEVAGSPLNVSLKDLWMDPCIEFAIKTLTGAIPIEVEPVQNKAPEIPEPSSESPFGDLWGDPCFEFAVKTLTGAIPVEDLSIEDYFQKGDKGSDFAGLGLCDVPSSDVPSQTIVTSGCTQNGNSSLLNAGDGGIHPHCEERGKSKDRQRHTVRL